MYEKVFCLRVNQVTLPGDIKLSRASIRIDVQPMGLSSVVLFRNTKLYPDCLRASKAPEFFAKYTDISDDFIITILLQNEKKEAIAACGIEAKWFPVNRVVREYLPMMLINKEGEGASESTPLVFVEVHLCENGGREFNAPLGLTKYQVEVIQHRETHVIIDMDKVKTPIFEEEESDIDFDAPREESEDETSEIGEIIEPSDLSSENTTQMNEQTSKIITNVHENQESDDEISQLPNEIPEVDELHKDSERRQIPLSNSEGLLLSSEEFQDESRIKVKELFAQARQQNEAQQKQDIDIEPQTKEIEENTQPSASNIQSINERHTLQKNQSQEDQQQYSPQVQQQYSPQIQRQGPLISPIQPNTQYMQSPQLTPAQPVPPQPAPTSLSGVPQLSPQLSSQGTPNSLFERQNISPGTPPVYKTSSVASPVDPPINERPERHFQYFFPSERQIQSFYVPPKPLSIPLYSRN
jgi:hypothetical protein